MIMLAFQGLDIIVQKCDNVCIAIVDMIKLAFQG